MDFNIASSKWNRISDFKGIFSWCYTKSTLELRSADISKVNLVKIDPNHLFASFFKLS